MTRGALFFLLTAFACAPLACGEEFTNGGGDANTTGNGGGAVTNTGAGAGGSGIGTGGMPPQGMCDDGSYEVPAVPTDWQGPIMVWQRQSDDAPPPCPIEGITLDVFNGLDGGTVDCNCDCTDPSVNNCSAALTNYNSSTTCNSGGTLVATLAANTCTPVSISGNGYLAWESQPACAPTPNNTIDEPHWGAAIRTCSLPTTDNMGTTCANPEDPFNNRICIIRDGYHECPAEYPVQTKVWDGYVDNRACTDCTCDSNGAMCTGSITFSGDSTCNAPSQGTLTDDECEMHAGISAYYGAQLDGNGTCPPSATSAVGELNATNERVICCTN